MSYRYAQFQVGKHVMKHTKDCDDYIIYYVLGCLKYFFKRLRKTLW